MYRRGQALARLALLSVGLLVTGCGPGGIRYPETGATLEGTVTYGQEKVGAALVIAQNDGGAATSFVDDDGRFKLENVPLGEVKIGVDTEAGKGQAMGRLQAASQGKAASTPKLVDVPGQYAEPSKSGIKTTIKKGANTFNIEIPK